MVNLINLEPELTLFGKIKNAIFLFGTLTIWLYLITVFLNAVLPSQIQPLDYLSQWWCVRQPSPIEIFFRACILAPFWEELAFRVGVIKLIKGVTQNKEVLLYGAIITSIFFGFKHGDAINILIQGVMSLGLFWLYLKNNNYYLNVLVHFLYNFFIIYGYKVIIS